VAADTGGTTASRVRARLLRLIASVPDRAVVLLLCLSLAAACAVLAEQFRPVTVLPLAVVLVVATWRLVPAAPGRAGQAAPAAVLATGAVAVWVLVNVRYAAQHLLVLRDPGFLTLQGIWLSRHPDPDLPLPEVTRFIGAINPDISATPAAYVPDGDELHVQGATLLSALLGVAGWAGGDAAVLVANVGIGGVALLAVYALARRLVGPWWGLLPVVALGASMPMAVFSRGAYTEPLTLAFVFGGLSVAWAALRGRRLLPHLLAGVLVGAAALARIDGAAVVVGLVLGLGLAAAAAVPPRRRAHLRAVLGVAVAGAVTMVGLGYLDLRVHSPGYLRDLMGQFRMLSAALVATVAGVLVLTWGRPWQRLRGWVLRQRRGLAWAAAALVVLAGVVLVSRPLWMVGRGFPADSPYAAAVEALQEREGLAPDGTRSYDEWSLIWVSWYHGWPFVALAVAGLAVAAWRGVHRRDPRWWTVLAAVSAPSALYLWQVSITPDQVWAMRRLLPVTLPGLAVMATVALSAAWQTRRWWARAGALVLAAAVALQPVTVWGGLLRVTEQSGRLTEIETVCAALTEDHVLYVRAGGPPYLATLRSVCDVDGLEMTAVPTAERLAGLREDWGADFDVVTFAAEAVPWADGEAPAPLLRTPVSSWRNALTHVPDGYVVDESAVWVGRVGTDGTVTPAEPRPGG
jgi:hypothetical protein